MRSRVVHWLTVRTTLCGKQRTSHLLYAVTWDEVTCQACRQRQEQKTDLTLHDLVQRVVQRA